MITGSCELSKLDLSTNCLKAIFTFREKFSFCNELKLPAKCFLMNTNCQTQDKIILLNHSK